MERQAPTDQSSLRPTPLQPLPNYDHGAGGNLPVPLTSFVGREREIAAAASALRVDGIRLLTLTGPGGVGKTRLAVRVAKELIDDFLDGVWFVSLATVDDPSLIAATVATAIGVREVAGRPIVDGLQAFLRGKHALLILDNFEHVLKAAPLVTDLLATCAQLTVLVTSRATLRLSGEHDLAVPPFAVPDIGRLPSLEALHTEPAVRLFIDRARAARDDFALTVENAATVARICNRLDGLPLAIELAAARSKFLPPQALLNRLEQRLPLLTGGPRDAPTRLRTMREAIAWSHDLLSEEEQTLFRRLGVFVGGFTLEAAGSVTQEPGVDVFAGVAALVDQSLVRRLDTVAGEPRFWMLEIVREFGLERLRASGEEPAIRARHATYFLARAEEANTIFWGRRPGSWRARLEPDLANLRAALAWFIERGDGERALRLAAALEPAWWILCHQTEGRRWLRQALALRAGVPMTVVVAALVVAGRIAGVQGDHAESLARGREALELAQRAGLPTADAVYLLGFFACNPTDPALGSDAAALASFEVALAAYRADEEPVRRVQTLNRIAEIVLRCPLPDLERVRGQYEEALTLSRAVGHTTGAAEALRGLADVARRDGDLATAAARYREGMVLYAATAHPWGIAMVFEDLAMLASDVGAAEQAASLFGTASYLRDELALPVPEAERPVYDAAVDRVRAALGAERFDAVWADARSRDTNEAVAAAEAWVTGLEQAQPTATPGNTVDTAGLSPREREVLHLLAAGMSDREIAAALAISYRTVTNHVGSILAKLDVPTRTAAVALAVRRGLV